MKKTTFSHSLLSLCLLFLISILGGGNAVNAQTTVTKTSFTDGDETGASLDKVVSYTTAKGDGTTPPAVKSGELRLYQPGKNKTYGNSITISVVDGYTLSSVSIKTSQATAYSYTLDESTDYSTKTSLSANATATVDGLSNKSITFYCMGASSSNRLIISSISVTYVSTASVGTTEPEISYSTSSLTIAANGTLTQPTLKNPNGVAIKSYSSSNKSVATVTDAGVIALAGGTGTATITATSLANETYAEGTATYTLTVFGAPEITPESGEYAKSVEVAISATGAADRKSVV